MTVHTDTGLVHNRRKSDKGVWERDPYHSTPNRVLDHKPADRVGPGFGVPGPVEPFHGMRNFATDKKGQAEFERTFVPEDPRTGEKVKFVYPGDDGEDIVFKEDEPSVMGHSSMTEVDPNGLDSSTPGAKHREINIGESDYADHPIQSWDVWIEYALNPWDADLVKRVIREKVLEGKTPDESRIQDYEKIKHICDERIHQIKNGNPYYTNLIKKMEKSKCD